MEKLLLSAIICGMPSWRQSQRPVEPEVLEGLHDLECTYEGSTWWEAHDVRQRRGVAHRQITSERDARDAANQSQVAETRVQGVVRVPVVRAVSLKTSQRNAECIGAVYVLLTGSRQQARLQRVREVEVESLQAVRLGQLRQKEVEGEHLDVRRHMVSACQQSGRSLVGTYPFPTLERDGEVADRPQGGTGDELQQVENLMPLLHAVIARAD